MGAHYEIILIELFFLSVKKSDDGCQNMGNCTRFGNRKTKSGALWSMAESISFPPGFLIWLLLRCETTTEPLLLMALLKHTAKSWSFQFTIIDLELSLLVESRVFPCSEDTPKFYVKSTSINCKDVLIRNMSCSEECLKSRSMTWLEACLD